MSHKIITTNNELCVCCMEKHNVPVVEVLEKTIFKGVEVEFKAYYKYCDNADEYYEEDEMINLNDTAMKEAYRQKEKQNENG